MRRSRRIVRFRPRRWALVARRAIGAPHVVRASNRNSGPVQFAAVAKLRLERYAGAAVCGTRAKARTKPERA